jgi:hypothetical protein
MYTCALSELLQCNSPGGARREQIPAQRAVADAAFEEHNRVAGVVLKHAANAKLWPDRVLGPGLHAWERGWCGRLERHELVVEQCDGRSDATCVCDKQMDTSLCVVGESVS